MSSHIVPREFAYYVSTAWGTGGGPADWSSNGTYCYATEIDTTGLGRELVDNANNRLTLRGFNRKILTRRNASLSCGFYLHSSPAHAAEAGTAASYHLCPLLKSALGGQDLGYAIGAASSEAEETDELEIDSDPGFVFGDATFIYDTSAARGEFYITQSIAAGPPVTLTLDRDLHFVVDPGGADRTYAVIDMFIDDTVTSDHTLTDHTTLWIRTQGQNTEDVQTSMGCKPQLGQITIAAGEPITIPLDVLVTTHTHETDTFEDFSAVTASGSAPAVPGLADQTMVKIAAVGSPLVEIDAYGSITINPGVMYEMSEGPNGWEGNHGFIDKGDDTTVEMMVDFDADWATAFHAQTAYHLLIQVGVGTDAIGFYFPRVEFSAYPNREAAGNITASKLMMRALKGTASISGLSAANARKLNSPMHIYLVA